MRDFMLLYAIIFFLASSIRPFSTVVASQTSDDFSVFSPDDLPAEILRSYLLKESDKLLETRRVEVQSLETPEALAERIERVRRDWMDALGPFPERTPLQGRTLGMLQADGYRIERVVYESRPEHHVTANLYLPQGEGPFPGVLVPCGHSRNGKASEAYQSICVLLALHGFAVLIYDPIGQGERCQLLDENGTPVVWGTVEHTLTDIGARLAGLGAANYRIWDGIRSLDYLISRPEVDPERIGCTGNSGGGTLTAYLMATDDRIWAAAPSCYITSLGRLFHTLGAQDGEQNITSQVAMGIDHADYVSLRAPKPTLLLTGTHDYFDIQGSWDTFREAKRVYGILGFGERVDLFEYPDKHGFSKPRREASLRWMRRWLQGVDDAAVEPEMTLQTDEALQVTESGQVVQEFSGKTVWDLNQERAESLRGEREAFWKHHSKQDCLAKIRELAGIRQATEIPIARKLGSMDRKEYTLEKILIERDGAPPMPGLWFIPRNQQEPYTMFVYVDGRGKHHDAWPQGPIETLVQEGHAVLSIDVRGTGETAIVKPREYLKNEYPLTYLAIHIGRPLLGQRAEDVLAGLEVALRDKRIDPEQIRVIGIERGGPVALHAAALDPRFKEVMVEGSIESWMDVVATPLAKQQLEQIIPCALQYYDLPDLVQAIHPRPVRTLHPVHPTGLPK